MSEYITIQDYFQKMQLNNEVPDSITRVNAAILLKKVNRLLSFLFDRGDLDKDEKIHVTSGWRSEEHNKKVGGAKKSNHVIGRAIDIGGAKIINIVTEEPHLLTSFGLYAESKNDTTKYKNRSWTHLQDVPPASGLRIFKA